MGPSLLRAVQNTGAEKRATYAGEGPARPGRPRAPAPAAAQLRLRGLGAVGDAHAAPSWPACTGSGCGRCSTRAPTSPRDVLRTQPAEGLPTDVTREGDVATDARGRPFVFDQNGLAAASLIDPTSPGGAALVARARPAAARPRGGRLHGRLRRAGAGRHALRRRLPRAGRCTTGTPCSCHRASAPRRPRGRAPPRRGGPGPSRAPARAAGRAAPPTRGELPRRRHRGLGRRARAASLGAGHAEPRRGRRLRLHHDIGGYISTCSPARRPPELYTRWTQWSALTPYFRVHNSASQETRRPWDFDPATYDRWLAMARLHERAVPYLRRLWRRGAAHRDADHPPALARRAAGGRAAAARGPGVAARRRRARGARRGPGRHRRARSACRPAAGGERGRGPGSAGRGRSRPRDRSTRCRGSPRCGTRPF